MGPRVGVPLLPDDGHPAGKEASRPRPPTQARHGTSWGQPGFLKASVRFLWTPSRSESGFPWGHPLSPPQKTTTSENTPTFYSCHHEDCGGRARANLKTEVNLRGAWPVLFSGGPTRPSPQMWELRVGSAFQSPGLLRLYWILRL